MRISGTYNHPMKLSIKHTDETQKSQSLTDDNFTELQSKYYSLKNILIATNDEIKELRHKNEKFVNVDVVNECITTQLSEFIQVQNTPRISVDLEQQFNDKIEELSTKLDELTTRTNILETKPVDIKQVPKLVLLRKK